MDSDLTLVTPGFDTARFKELLKSYGDACSFHHGRQAARLQQEIVAEYGRAAARIAELEAQVAECAASIEALDAAPNLDFALSRESVKVRLTEREPVWNPLPLDELE